MKSQGGDTVKGSRSRSTVERPASHASVVKGEDASLPEPINEEKPSMRAVALVATPLVHGSLGSHQLGSLQTPSFGMLRPLGSLKEGFTVKKEWSGEVKVPSSWVLTSDKLEPVPLDFPLERTHREIYHVDPCVVASRISDALRILSIEAEYDCQRAKAKCRTSDFVSFRIRLYAGGENNQPVVVEVQRRSGSGISFMQSCRAILDAAEGSKNYQSAKKRGPGSPFLTLGGLKCLQGIAPSTVVTHPLEDVLPLLSSNKRDANILGMEKLSHLTDPLKTRPTVALQICKIIALGDATFSVREDTIAILQRDAFASEFDPEESENGGGYMEQMRHWALLVFSNSFSMTSKEGSLVEAVKEQLWYGETLFPILLDEVKNASVRPHCALEAACAMFSFVEVSDVARKFLLRSNCVEILEEAHAIGMERHELLANETKRCLIALNAT